MKIAVFTDTYSPKVDGIVTSITNSTQALAGSGHKIIIFAPQYKEEEKLQLHPNIKVYRSFSLSLLSYNEVKLPIPNIAKITSVIKNFKPDLIHIHTPATIGLLGIFFSKLYDIPSVGTYHTILSEQITYLSLKRLTKLDRLIEKIKSKKAKTNSILSGTKLEKFLKSQGFRKMLNAPLKEIKEKDFGKKMIWKMTCNIYNRCSLITVPSKSIKKELKKYGLTKPIKIISNGVDLSNFTPKKGYKVSKKLNLLHVGRIGFEKNIDVVIRSFKLLIKQRKNICLKIVGDGPALQSLKNLAESLNLKNKITFTGYLHGKDLVKAFQKSDIFVTTSTMETQGLAILEAMSCGLPIIGVRKYAIPDLVKHNINGYIAEPFTEEEIKQYIMEFIKNPRLLERFGKRSVEIAKKHDLKKTTNRLATLYKLTKESS